jgi:hypothetical protein
VVSAISNQTQILKQCVDRVKVGELVNGEDLQCSYALKWVVHFLGDIAQPLHASGRAAGGNGIEVVFGNLTTELHAVSLASLISSVHGSLTPNVGMGWLYRLRRRKRHEFPQHNHPAFLQTPRLSHPEKRL